MLAKMGKYCMLMVQEPPINVYTSTMRGFARFDRIAYGKKPRAGLVYPRGEKVTPLPHISNKDFACALWEKYKEGKTLICSYYFDQDRNIEEGLSWIEEARIYATSRGYSVIMQGDSNVHSLTWGSTEEDKKGRDKPMEDWIAKNNMTICNDGSPTWENARYQTHIVVTILDPRMATRERGWSATFAISATDHALIELKLMDPQEPKGKKIKSTNLRGFTNALSQKEWKEPKWWDPRVLDRETRIFTKLVTGTWEQFSKFKYVASPKNEWWDEECEKSEKDVLKQVKRASRHKTEEEYKALKIARYEHRKLTRRKRKARKRKNRREVTE